MHRESRTVELWKCRYCGLVVKAVLPLTGAECSKGHLMKRIWKLGEPEIEEAALVTAGKG